MNMGFWIAVALALLAGLVLAWLSSRVPVGNREPRSRRGRGIIVAALLLVPLLALGLQFYFRSSTSPSVPAPSTAAQNSQASSGGTSGMPSGDAAGHEPADMERMVSQLEERLRSNPDDGEGWLMLARSHAFLEQHQQAAQAYEKALEQLGDDPQLLTRYAESLMLSVEGGVPPKVSELVERALELDPDNSSAVWMSGVVAFQNGEFERAGKQWQRVLAQLTPGSENERVVRQALADVEEALGRQTR